MGYIQKEWKCYWMERKHYVLKFYPKDLRGYSKACNDVYYAVYYVLLTLKALGKHELFLS
jgi:hypothetical protein